MSNYEYTPREEDGHRPALAVGITFIVAVSIAVGMLGNVTSSADKAKSKIKNACGINDHGFDYFPSQLPVGATRQLGDLKFTNTSPSGNIQFSAISGDQLIYEQPQSSSDLTQTAVEVIHDGIETKANLTLYVQPNPNGAFFLSVGERCLKKLIN